jgi:hypothetical protein
MEEIEGTTLKKEYVVENKKYKAKVPPPVGVDIKLH